MFTEAVVTTSKFWEAAKIPINGQMDKGVVHTHNGVLFNLE